MAVNKKYYLGFDPEKSVLLRFKKKKIHFKNTHEVGAVIKGMKYTKSLKYLNDVIKHKRAVPFRRFKGGVGRTAQGKEWGVSQARWPVKSCSAILELLLTAKGAIATKGLDTDKLVIQRVVTNRAPCLSRRSYRAHGRVQTLKYEPSHVTIILAERQDPVPKSKAITT